jgi:hypothetical protein
MCLPQATVQLRKIILQKFSAENRFAEWLFAKFFRIFFPGNLFSTTGLDRLDVPSMCGKRRCANLEQCAMEKLGRNVLFIK